MWGRVLWLLQNHSTAVARPGQTVWLVYWHHRNCSAGLSVSAWQPECLSSCSTLPVTAQPRAVSNQCLISVHTPVVTQREKSMDLNKTWEGYLTVILDLQILSCNDEMKFVQFLFALFSQSTGGNPLCQGSLRNETYCCGNARGTCNGFHCACWPVADSGSPVFSIHLSCLRSFVQSLDWYGWCGSMCSCWYRPPAFSSLVVYTFKNQHKPKSQVISRITNLSFPNLGISATEVWGCLHPIPTTHSGLVLFLFDSEKV